MSMSRMTREDVEEQERAEAEYERMTAAALRRKHGEWVCLGAVSATHPHVTGPGCAAASFASQRCAMATNARHQYLTALYEARRRFQSFLLLLESGKDIWVETKSEPYRISGMTKLEAELLANGLRVREFEVEIRPSSSTSRPGETSLGRGENETFDILITDPVLTLKL